MLGGEPDPRRRPRASAVARRRAGLDDGAGDLGVVTPRPPVEVVGADGEPLVVDDADLRVHVDRGVVLVDQVVDRDARAAGGDERAHHVAAADRARRSRDPPGRIREPRDDDDDAQVGLAPQRVDERAARPSRTRGTGPRGRRAGGRGRTRGGTRGRCSARRRGANGNGRRRDRVGAERSASRTDPTAAGVGRGPRHVELDGRGTLVDEALDELAPRARGGRGGSGRSTARRTCRRRPGPPGRAARPGGRATADAAP